MVSLAVSFVVLLAGYFLYGRFIERVFGPDDRKTPAMKNPDGVDCVPISTGRLFLVQLLNIAGTGPIFGALMGAAFGPVVFLWIVLGAVFAGAVHDYVSAMMSCRRNGDSVVELCKIYLGGFAGQVMKVVSVVLLVLVGAVFVGSPAALLERLVPGFVGADIWAIVIVLYYLLATLLPIDKIIARLYPVFGAVLLLMAVMVISAIVFGGRPIPEITLESLHPSQLPAWPFMFVTVACGAISGFHVTQSPIAAKCIKSEKDGRKVFYGAMICESVIALLWAAAGVAFYGTTGGLVAALSSLGQSSVVYDISTGLLGVFGGALAVIGVIICPVSTGDTAFRSARMIVAEAIGLPQAGLRNRLLIAVPLVFMGFMLTKINFDVLWRYFSWTNQTIAMIVLWMASSYLIREGKKVLSLVTALPGAFMSAVSMTYILMAKEGFGLPASVAYPSGVAFAVVCFGVYAFFAFRRIRSN